MAYAGSKAISALNTVISIGSTPVVIGEVTDIIQSGRSMKTDSTTNMQSTAEEFIGTIVTPGDWDISVNRIAGDAGQIAVEAAFATGLVTPFTVQEPKGSFTTSGPKWTYNAVVTESNFSYSADKHITGKMKFKVSGMPIQTAGV